MRLALGVLAAAVAGGLAFIAQRELSVRRTPQPWQNGDEHSGAAANGGEPTGRGHPLRPAPGPSPNQRADAGDERQKRGEGIYWWVTGTASVVATIATGAAAWFAFGAYTAAWESVAESRKQVAAALAANEISRRAMAEAVGASVHVSGPGIETFDDPDGATRLKVGVTISNGGSSTTRGMSYVAACFDADATVPEPFDDAAPAANPVFRIALGPKESIHPILCDYGPTTARRIVAQRRRIYVFGRITHRDTIEPSMVRRVEFCHMLHHLGLRGGARMRSVLCDKHNCSDEECDEEETTAATRRNLGKD